MKTINGEIIPETEEELIELSKYIDEKEVYYNSFMIDGLLEKQNINKRLPELPYKYMPVDHQKKFWDFLNVDEDGNLIYDHKGFCIKKEFKRIIKIWPRRHGKDINLWNMFILASLLKKGNYWYMLPTAKQAKGAIFNSTANDGMDFIDYLPKEYIHPDCFKYGSTSGWDKTNMSVKLINGSTIQLIGFENYDRLVGANPSGLVFSEYSVGDKSAWDYLAPIVMANQGFAWFVYTPRGRNHGYDLYNKYKDDKNWTVSKLDVYSAGYYDEDEIEYFKKESGSKFQQEWMTSFDAPVEGAYYDKYINEIYDENRYTDIEELVNKELPFRTFKVAFDIGINDCMALTFYQEFKGKVIVFYYYENRDFSIGHYLDEIKRIEKKLKIKCDQITLPHDGSKRDVQLGKTTEQFVREEFNTNGSVYIKKLSRAGIQEGIENARRVLPSCLFVEDDSLKDYDDPTFNPSRGTNLLLNRLASYSKVYNKKKNTYENKPYHDHNAHGADSFRYMSMDVDKVKLDTDFITLLRKSSIGKS